MERYEVTVLAGGNPFWCVDEERRLLDWIDRTDAPRFSRGSVLSNVRTISLDSSSTALELRWTSIEADGPWLAARKAVASIEETFPDVVSASFLRVQTTLQDETDQSSGRWSKPARMNR